MNVDTAKRIVAIKRTIAAYGAMRKRGDLEKDEYDVLVGELEAEAVCIRGQMALLLKTPSGGAVQAPSAPQGRTSK